MLLQPFLTDLDPQADVKGSVDPMGATPIWSRMGRRVIGNLTTVSNSVRDFKTLVLGFAAIEQLQQQSAMKDVDELGLFLRWEQLAAYVRGHFLDDFDFRGTTRVRRRLSESAVVRLGRGTDAQILGNQKVYGLWGLFSVPARSSGLLDEHVSRPAEAAKGWVRSRVSRAGPSWDAALKLVAEDSRRLNLDASGRAEHLKHLARIWKQIDGDEREFWTKHLVSGGPTDSTIGRQHILAELLHDSLSDKAWSPRRVRALAKAANARDQVLADYLEGIAACESVLAPAAAVFALLQARDRQRVAAVAKELESAWGASLGTVDVKGFGFIRPQLAAASGDTLAELWVHLAENLAAGSYAEAIRLVLRINAEVMKSRGGAPWVTDEGGLLRVRFRDDKQRLPTKKELRDLWRNPYFLESLRLVSRELAA